MHNLETELHDLRTRLTAAEQELARVRQPRRRRSARTRLGAAAALAVLLALVPLSLFAANPFNDLVPGSVHNANIDAIYNAGITTGCVPNVSYCPTANVTRQEMASFLARTAGLGGNPPVANALTAVSAQNAVNAASAGNANTVGGYAPNSLLRVARGDGPAVYPGVVGLSTSYKTVASVTIEVPGPGFVLVTGTTMVLDNTIGSNETDARLRDTGAGGLASPYIFAYIGAAAGASKALSLTPTYVFPVAAAGARTFVLEVRNVAGQGFATNAAITALYVPFGSAGAGTLSIDNPPAPSGQPSNP